MKDIFIFLPINDSNNLYEGISGSHWSLLVAHVNTKKIYHIDSMRLGGVSSSRQVLAVQQTVEAFNKLMRYLERDI